MGGPGINVGNQGQVSVNPVRQRGSMPLSGGAYAPKPAGIRNPGGNTMDPRSFGNNSTGLAMALRQPQQQPQQSPRMLGGVPPPVSRGYGNWNEDPNAVQRAAVMPGYGGGQPSAMPGYGGGQSSLGGGLNPATGQFDPNYRGGGQPQGGMSNMGSSDAAIEQMNRGGGGGQPTTGNNQPLRGYDFNIPRTGEFGSSWRNTTGMLETMPNETGLVNTMENPSDVWNSSLPGAQDYMRRQFEGGGPDVGQRGNRFLDYGEEALRGATPLPNAPNLLGPNQYSRPGDPRFNYDNAAGPTTGRFDPNTVTGPNTSGDFSGPNVNVPQFDYNELLRTGTTGGMGQVPREKLTGSGFNTNEDFTNPNAISRRAFESGLTATGNLANTGGVDLETLGGSLSAADQATIDAAVATGANRGMSRGSAPGTGTVASREISGALAPAVADITRSRRAELVNLAGQKQAGQIAGAGGLTDLGTAASGAARGNAGLYQTEAGSANEFNTNMRGQDIDLARLSGDQYGRNISGVADLIRATTGAQNEAYGRGTERGLGQSEIGLRGYEATTGREIGRGNIFNEGERNATDAYRARGEQYGRETTRGLGEGELRARAAELGFDYDQLSSQDRNEFNRQMNEQYATRTGAENERFRDTLRGASDFADTENNAQNQAADRQLRQALGLGDQAIEMMQSSQQGQQALNEMRLAAMQGDLGRAMQAWQIWADDVQRGRENRQTWGGVVGSAIGAAGQIGGAYLASRGNRTPTAPPQ